MYRKISKAKLHSGFTLVELLTVMAIISILAGIVYASLGEARKKARDTARYNDLRQIELALKAFGSAYDRYPSAEDVNNNLSRCRHDTSFAPDGCMQVLIEQGFFNDLPEDELNEIFGTAAHEGHKYFYDNWCRNESGNGTRVDTQYRLWTYGEQNHDAYPKWWDDEVIGVTTCDDPS